ncbi:hypothetical protein JCM10213_001373 [Rhodosporidiobolus nylandii]
MSASPTVEDKPMSREELVQRLCTAVAEEDLLYVLYWIGKLRARGELEEAIHEEDPCTHFTALDLAVSRPENVWNRLVLQVLLLLIDEPLKLPAATRARQESQWWAYQMMAEWNISGKAEATDARDLLAGTTAEAAAWMDSHLPDHPEQNSFTGLAWGHPGKQLRLSGVPPQLDAAALQNYLPRLEGLFDLRPISFGIFIALFTSGFYARGGLEVLLARKDSIVAQLEADYQTSLGFPPPPLDEPLPAAPPRPPPILEPVDIWVNNLPFDATEDEVRGLLVRANVKPVLLSMRQKQGSTSLYCQGQLSSASDFVKASIVLHRTYLRENMIYFNRDPPQIEHPSRPFVFLHNLPPNTDKVSLAALAKRSGCGAYGFEVMANAEGATGWMRFGTDETAELAARYLDGQLWSGRVVKAEWRAAATGEASVAPVPPLPPGPSPPPPPPTHYLQPEPLRFPPPSTTSSSSLAYPALHYPAPAPPPTAAPPIRFHSGPSAPSTKSEAAPPLSRPVRALPKPPKPLVLDLTADSDGSSAGSPSPPTGHTSLPPRPLPQPPAPLTSSYTAPQYYAGRAPAPRRTSASSSAPSAVSTAQQRRQQHYPSPEPSATRATGSWNCLCCTPHERDGE